MSHPRGLSVRIESVSDLTDVPILASIFDAAIIASGDDFRELLKRYVEDPYTEVEQRLEAALLHPSVGSAEQHFVFKAVETVPSLSTADSQGNGPQNAVEVQGVMPTKESIVGMAHWTVGYIDLPKVDPFAQEPTSLPTTTGPQESAGQTRLEEPMPSSVEVVNIGEHESSFDFYAVCRKPIRNTYISQIRGKKHICKCCSLYHPPSCCSVLQGCLNLPFHTYSPVLVRC